MRESGKTYAFEVGLESGQNLLDCAFDKHATNEAEALAVGIFLGCFGERVDDEPGAAHGTVSREHSH